MGVWIAALVIAANPSLETDKLFYGLGEPVQFILDNRSNRAVSWSSVSDYPQVWRILEDDTEEPARELPLIMLPALGVLAPGEEKRWEWDQREYLQAHEEAPDPEELAVQTAPGNYIGRFTTFEFDELETERFQISSEPMNVRPGGKAAALWGALKGQ